MIKRLSDWLLSEWQKLQEVRDTPHAVALGFAAGIYIGFYPLVGLKTLLALILAWLLRSNKIAAVVGVTLHDISLPIAPILMRIEYDVGYWVLSRPHHMPDSLTHLRHVSLHEYLNWHTMLTTGAPLLLGSALLGIPFAIAIYFLMLGIINARRGDRSA
jgi:uncharacterized protein (DUF2062 family)